MTAERQDLPLSTEEKSEYTTWEDYTKARRRLKQLEPNAYNHQLRLLKQRLENIKKRHAEAAAIISSANDNTAQEQQVAALLKLSTQLELYINDIEAKKARTFFFGTFSSYATHDLTKSLHLCDEMLKDPTETSINAFLIQAPKTGNGEIAWNVAKALACLVFIAAVFLFVCEAMKWMIALTVAAFPFHDFSYIYPPDYFFNELTWVLADVFFTVNVMLFGAAAMECGNIGIKNCYHFFSPTYDETSKRNLTDAAKVCKQSNLLPPIVDPSPTTGSFSEASAPVMENVNNQTFTG